MSEEIIKKAIESLNSLNPDLKLEIKERRHNFLMLPSILRKDGTSTEEVVSNEIEITIFINGEQLYTAGYFSDKPEYRPIAFERMLHTIISSGLVNHPTVRQLRKKEGRYDNV